MLKPEYLIGNIWVGLWKFGRNTFETVFLSIFYINMRLFKMFGWYTFKISFNLNKCLVCSHFPLLNMMQRACFCWLFFFSNLSCKYLPKQQWHTCEYTKNIMTMRILYLKVTLIWIISCYFFNFLFSLFDLRFPC